MKNIAAIILAAGEGKRMNSLKTNKVISLLEGKPMILRTVEKLQELSIDTIIIVVGFAKDSVKKVLDNRVIFAEQNKRLGTAHAVSCALKKLPEGIKTLLVLGGDDSAFFSKETIVNLINLHLRKKAALSFLTIMIENPAGLGRIVRDVGGKVTGIVEDKDATKEQKTIKEINPGCYVFEVSFLRKYLAKINKSPVSGEYYLTSLVDIAMKNKENIQVVAAGKIPWRGINTPEDLKEAERLFLTLK